VTLVIMLAAGLVGAYSQMVAPARPGAEMWHLAASLADHGTFANPYGHFKTGPAALNPPLFPLFLAGLIKLFRVPSLVYGAAVLCSILANAITVALLPRISVVFYDDPIPGIIASVLWLPAMQPIPGWDTNYTHAALIFFICFTASFSSISRHATRDAILAGLSAGLLCLLNPVSMIVLLPWIVFLILNAEGKLVAARNCGIALTVMCLVAGIWIMRNHRVLGGYVIRTGLGITLYVSNNDCAQPSLVRNEMNGCFQKHFPDSNTEEAELFHRVGEIQYDRIRIAETKAWIRNNPAKFLNLTVARIVQFWFPPAENIPSGFEFSNITLRDYRQRWEKLQNRIAYSIWIITGFSFLGLAVMIKKRQPVVLFLLSVMAIFPVLYYVSVSDVRYRYPILWLSLLPAGYFISEAVKGNLLPFRKASPMPVSSCSS
jgi:hypothetical protein